MDDKYKARTFQDETMLSEDDLFASDVIDFRAFAMVHGEPGVKSGKATSRTGQGSAAPDLEELEDIALAA